MRTFSSLRRLGAFAFAAALLGLAGHAACAADLVVIVSAKSQVSVMRADQVAAIFLGQTPRFPDGAEAVPLDQRLGSPLRDEFYERVAGKTPPLLKAYWSKMVFTGRGQPPGEAGDSAAVRRRVAENPDLIGYIERSALDASVRPVLVVQ
jgi:ABC-type phosphate transport system substrate-binding protein